MQSGDQNAIQESIKKHLTERSDLNLGAMEYEVKQVNIDRDQATAGAQICDNIFKIGRVLDGRSGDTDKLTAHGHQFEGLFDAQGGIHRVASQHGLFHDGMIATHHKAAVIRITDDDFARLAAMI